MKWFWYVARADELMMDCDGHTLLEIAVKRLQRSRDQIDPLQIFVSSSYSTEHFHFIIRLRRKMGALERQIWQLFLMDHTYRSVKNLFRVLHKIPSPSLLISPYEWDTRIAQLNPHGCLRFWRKADAICWCESHKDPEKIWKCPAHIKLRGRRNELPGLRSRSRKGS